MVECLPNANTGSTTFSAADPPPPPPPWMTTNCQESTGSVSDLPRRAWVKRTRSDGLRVSTITLEMVARATTLRLPREWLG